MISVTFSLRFCFTFFKTQKLHTFPVHLFFDSTIQFVLMTQFQSALPIERKLGEIEVTLNLVSGQTCLTPDAIQDTAGIFPTLDGTRKRLSRDCDSIYRKPDRINWKNSAFWQILRSKTKHFGIMQSTRWESCSDFWLVNKNLEESDSKTVSVPVQEIFHVFLRLRLIFEFSRDEHVKTIPLFSVELLWNIGHVISDWLLTLISFIITCHLEILRAKVTLFSAVTRGGKKSGKCFHENLFSKMNIFIQ